MELSQISRSPYAKKISTFCIQLGRPYINLNICQCFCYCNFVSKHVRCSSKMSAVSPIDKCASYLNKRQHQWKDRYLVNFLQQRSVFLRPPLLYMRYSSCWTRQRHYRLLCARMWHTFVTAVRWLTSWWLGRYPELNGFDKDNMSTIICFCIFNGTA